MSPRHKPMRSSALTAKRLRALLHYNPRTGVFRRIVRSGPAMPGDVAGGDYANGYAAISVDGVVWFAHRLAWLYVHGKIPDGSDVCFVTGADKLRPRISELYLARHGRRRAP